MIRYPIIATLFLLAATIHSLWTGGSPSSVYGVISGSLCSALCSHRWG